MAKLEEKDQKIENHQKKKSLKALILKEKTVSILNGIAVQSTFNNTIISIADTNGNVVLGFSGQKVLKDLENQHHMQLKLLLMQLPLRLLNMV